MRQDSITEQARNADCSQLQENVEPLEFNIVPNQMPNLALKPFDQVFDKTEQEIVIGRSMLCNIALHLCEVIAYVSQKLFSKCFTPQLKRYDHLLCFLYQHLKCRHMIWMISLSLLMMDQR